MSRHEPDEASINFGVGFMCGFLFAAAMTTFALHAVVIWPLKFKSVTNGCAEYVCTDHGDCKLTWGAEEDNGH